MNKIIYYVATSLDGYITAPNEDVSHFIGEGDGVQKYLNDLAEFKTVIMGRKTYEFGYQFGLEPGMPAYPHMTHYLFSNTLKFEKQDELIHIKTPEIETIKAIRDKSPTDVYLCGGGQFAGWLLDHGMIDQLKLKINPIILGGGIKLFGDSQTQAKWVLTEATSYEKGLQINTYNFE
ncbi:MAG: dihydrofolate reductase family protein [Chitinophagales bacterium]|nr:dihydrofolate reductase family protein [Chitinophagales bacterium]